MRRLLAIIPVAIALATCLAFWPTLQGEFNWDDEASLVNNPHYRGFGAPQLRWMFTTTLMGHYMPLTWLSLAVDYTLGRMNPWVYHLTSLLLHVFNAVLFYLVVYALTTVGAFAVAAWLVRDTGRDDVDDLDGLGFESPGLAACIVVLMLSLIGIPPLAGFFAKLYLFLEVLNADSTARPMLLGLVALALFNSVISVFYYVRVLRAMYLRRGGRKPRPAPRGVSWPIGLATLVLPLLCSSTTGRTNGRPVDFSSSTTTLFRSLRT